MLCIRIIQTKFNKWSCNCFFSLQIIRCLRLSLHCSYSLSPEQSQHFCETTCAHIAGASQWFCVSCMCVASQEEKFFFCLSFSSSIFVVYSSFPFFGSSLWPVHSYNLLCLIISCLLAAHTLREREYLRRSKFYLNSC